MSPAASDAWQTCGSCGGRAGQPSYRELAKRAHYSDTTLLVTAGGTVMPSLAATLAFVRACGGDTALLAFG